MKKKIYMLGTTHGTPTSKKETEVGIREIIPDVIFLEGTTGGFSLEEKLKEPLLWVILKLYYYFFGVVGDEFDVAIRVGKELEIPIRKVDRTRSELVQYFHRWYNFLLPPTYLLFLYGLFYGISSWTKTPVPLVVVLIMLLMGAVLYFLYFVKVTKDIRDDSFAAKIKDYMEKEGYNKAFLVCGRYHPNDVKEKIGDAFEVIER